MCLAMCWFDRVSLSFLHLIQLKFCKTQRFKLLETCAHWKILIHTEEAVKCPSLAPMLCPAQVEKQAEMEIEFSVMFNSAVQK